MTNGKFMLSKISPSFNWPMEGSGKWLALGIFVWDLITSTVGLKGIYDKSLLFKWVNTSVQRSVKVLTLCGVQEILNYLKRTVLMAPCSALLKKKNRRTNTDYRLQALHWRKSRTGFDWPLFLFFGTENTEDGWFQDLLEWMGPYLSEGMCVLLCFGFWLIHNSLWTCC